MLGTPIVLCFPLYQLGDGQAQISHSQRSCSRRLPGSTQYLRLQSVQFSWPKPRHPVAPEGKGESLLARRQRSPLSLDPKVPFLRK